VPEITNVLIVRTDRLGDVLLTTPLSSALREAFPKAQISWLVRPYAAPLLDTTRTSIRFSQTVADRSGN